MLECLSPLLFELDFKASGQNHCLLTLTRNGHTCWIGVWVDDFLYGSTDSQITTLFIDKVSERSNVGESGPLKFFFEISLKWGRFADNEPSGNVSNLLRKHRASQCKAASTPLTDKRELTKHQMQDNGSDVQQQMLEIDYRCLVGSIVYLSLSNRPNLALPDQPTVSISRQPLIYSLASSEVRVTLPQRHS